MLHDLLFALSGYPGNVFTDKGNQFQVNTDFNILTSSEKAQLDQIIQVGFYYKCLNRFITRNLNASLVHESSLPIAKDRRKHNSSGVLSYEVDNEKENVENQRPAVSDDNIEPSGDLDVDFSLLNGLYLRSVCMGIDKQLDRYRNLLVEAERTVLKDPNLPMSYLRCLTEEFRILFIALYEIVNEIKAQSARGCQILSLLFEKSQTGIPYVQKAVLEILHVCHGVLFKQLLSWMAYGVSDR